MEYKWICIMAAVVMGSASIGHMFEERARSECHIEAIKAAGAAKLNVGEIAKVCAK